jgi:hypothetical protein
MTTLTREYYWRSPVGMFWIRPQPGHPGRYSLGNAIEGALGSYRSAEAAADDFAGGHTGWKDWDLIFRYVRNVPRDLTEWHRGRPRA